MYSWFDKGTVIKQFHYLTPTAYTEYILKAMYCSTKIVYLSVLYLQKDVDK